MLAPSYLAATLQTAETMALDDLSPLVRLEVRSIDIPDPPSSGLWLLSGCAEFEERGLNSKYAVRLMAEKVEEDWKFWLPEAACIHCPLKPCSIR